MSLHLPARRIAIVLGLALSILPLSSRAEPSPEGRASASSDAALYAASAQLQLPRLAPGATHVAFVASARGLQSVLLRDNATGKLRPLHRLNSPELSITAMEWLDEQRLLVQVEVGGLEAEQVALAHQALLVLPVEGDKPVNLYSGAGDHIDWGNVRGRMVSQPVLRPDQVLLYAYQSDGVSVVRIRTKDARRQVVVSPMRDVQTYWADRDGAVRAALRRNAGRSELLLRRPGESSWITPRGWSDGSPEAWLPLGFDADARFFLVHGRHEGQPALLRIDTQAPEAPAQLLHGGPEHAGTLRLLRRSSDGAPVGVVTRSGSHYFADQLGELMLGLKAALPEQRLRLLQWQGPHYLLHSSAVDQPPRYWLGRRTEGKLDPIAAQFLELPEQLPLRRLETGSAELPVALYRSPDDSPRPVVWCMPCTLSRFDDDSAFNPVVAFLVSRGWAVLVPRPRSGATPGENIVQGSDRRLRQARAAMDLALADAHLGLDARRQALIVGNLYAYDGLRWAQQEPSRFQALVALDALTNLRRYARLAGEPYAESTRQATRRALDGLDADAMAAASPFRQPALLPPQLLLVHASHSASVNIGHAEDLARARRDENLPVELIRLKDSTDQIFHGPQRQQVLEAVERSLAAVTRN